MDGYAVRSEDLYGASETTPVSLKVVGRIDPGDAKYISIGQGEAIEISTGAPIPPGADSVLMVEYTKRSEDEVIVYRSVTPGENIAPSGSDIMLGELILRRCTVIGEREVGVLASVGVKRIRVYRRPRVAVISTGRELIPPGSPLEFGKIYDVNSYTISHALKRLGAEPLLLGIAGDDPKEIEDMVEKGLGLGDMVILSGGTSAGLSDITYKVLSNIGPPGIVVHGLKVKPGKPTVISISREGKLVIGLPGYPSSALMIFDLIVKPLIKRMLCLPEEKYVIKARLAMRVEGARGRRLLLPVSLVDVGSYIAAYPLPSESGAISTVAQADGYTIIPENVEFAVEGENVYVNLFSPAYMPSDLYIVGSHDLGLDRLIPLMRGYKVKTIYVGSIGGIMSVKRGEADIAGIHLVDSETMEYNIPFLKKYGVDNAYLIKGYMREQGIIVPKGNPHGIKDVRDIIEKNLRIVNRGRNTGTRILLDSILREIAKEEGMAFDELVSRIRGYYYEAKTHTAVATAIAQGRADAGIGIRAAAHMYGLDFIALGWERYDFLVQKARIGKEAVKAFLEILRSSEFAEILSSIPGYIVPKDIGEIIFPAL
jgi:putative molybdopterin biosynthesis protein